MNAIAHDYIAVDWSGAAGPRVPGIWIAVVRDGRVGSLLQPGSREAAQAWLLARLADPQPCVIGLDFAFGFPAWWCAEQRWRCADDAWAAASAHGEEWLAACAPPFWGRAGRGRPHPHAVGLRATDMAVGGAPKSVFQVGGAGSVGTGSVRGMPVLRVLRAAGAAVWPMHEPARHTVLEIYPRRLTPPGTVKRDAGARARVLASIGDGVLDGAARATAVASEDAFDAVLAALGMARGAAESAWVLPSADAAERLEGRIWVPARVP